MKRKLCRGLLSIIEESIQCGNDTSTFDKDFLSTFTQLVKEVLKEEPAEVKKEKRPVEVGHWAEYTCDDSDPDMKSSAKGLVKYNNGVSITFAFNSNSYSLDYCERVDLIEFSQEVWGHDTVCQIKAPEISNVPFVVIVRDGDELQDRRVIRVTGYTEVIAIEMAIRMLAAWYSP